MVTQGLGGRYAAFIFPKARSNTAKPESLPDIPSTQPRACHRRMNTPHIGRLNFPQFEA